MDGGGNGVKTMRAFKESDENFITILDKNQVTERKFKYLKNKKRYKYGDADIVDCKIELIDSLEKDYICELRAVIISWDNGRESVLVSDISTDLLDASEIVKRYFDRWPMQEKRFRDEKSGINIHRIVGYGKKLEDYNKMKEKHVELCQKIKKIKLELKKPLKRINELKNELKVMCKQERILREKSKIEIGKRKSDNQKNVEMLKKVEFQILKNIRNQNKIKKEDSNNFNKLEKLMKEKERIRVKDKIYKIDTELDQIMTCFKLSFANLCSYFLKECMNNEKYELLKLFESVFQLKGKAVITEKKLIHLQENKKEPSLMVKMQKVLKKLNIMELHNFQGKKIMFDFALV